MKRIIVALLSVLALQSAYAQARENNFSLKNNSNHKIMVSFYTKGATKPLTVLNIAAIEPWGEKSFFNPNFKNVERMAVRYCDGPDDTSCTVCVEDEHLNEVCEYKHVYFTVNFTPAQTDERTYHLKFSIKGGTHSREGGRPMVEAQKGEYGKLTHKLRHNITTDEIIRGKVSHKAP